MRRLFAVLLIVMFPMTVLGQKTRTVIAEYTYHVPSDISLEQARLTALERAKVQAIADNFGTLVGNVSTAGIDGEGTNFTSLGISEVRGEWVETLSEPTYSINYEQNMLVVKVRVKGRIREFPNPGIDMKIELLNESGPTSDFQEGDRFFLSFQSAVKGYLAAYLFDGEDSVFCLLPYSGTDGKAVLVQGGAKKLFFSYDDAELAERPFVEEYRLTCSHSSEINRVYIVFSTHEFAKAVDNDGENRPRTLTYKDFQTWLARSRSHDSNMQVGVRDIVIRKRPTR